VKEGSGGKRCDPDFNSRQNHLPISVCMEHDKLYSIVPTRWSVAVKAAETGAGHANALKTLFFSLCFFSVGLATNVRKLWVEGIGRVIVVYGLSVFGFIMWIGLLICWVFYHGVMPPVMVR
jgi:hypothetical protein